MTDIEETLHDFIDLKIAEVKADNTIIDLAFPSKTSAQRTKIKNYFNDTSFRTTYHFPRDPAELPCIAIVLRAMDENTQLIGSIVPDLYVTISQMEDGWITPTTNSGDLAQGYSTRFAMSGNRSCRLTGTSGNYANDWVELNLEETLTSGIFVNMTGLDKIEFWVQSNRTGSFMKFGFGEAAGNEQEIAFPVTVQGFPEKITLDISGIADADKDDVVFFRFTPTDDSEDLDIFISDLKVIWALEEAEEAVFDNMHTVEVWSGNPEETIILFNYLKWLFLANRDYLETTWNYFEQKIGGQDLMLNPEWFPEFVYVRALSFSCKTLETAAISAATALTQVNIIGCKED